MQKSMNWFAFLLGLAVALSCAAVLKRMGAPLRLDRLSLVQASALAGEESALSSNGSPYSIDWYTADAGGGLSNGNGFELTASIGQPDAGKSAEGSFTLEGGFLPGTFQPWRTYLPSITK